MVSKYNPSLLQYTDVSIKEISIFQSCIIAIKGGYSINVAVGPWTFGPFLFIIWPWMVIALDVLFSICPSWLSFHSIPDIQYIQSAAEIHPHFAPHVLECAYFFSPLCADYVVCSEAKGSVKRERDILYQTVVVDDDGGDDGQAQAQTSPRNWMRYIIEWTGYEQLLPHFRSSHHTKCTADSAYSGHNNRGCKWALGFDLKRPLYPWILRITGTRNTKPEIPHFIFSLPTFD